MTKQYQIDQNKPHVTMHQMGKNLWDVYWPRGNMILGATNFTNRDQALAYARHVMVDEIIPLRIIDIE